MWSGQTLTASDLRIIDGTFLGSNPESARSFAGTRQVYLITKSQWFENASIKRITVFAVELVGLNVFLGYQASHAGTMSHLYLEQPFLFIKRHSEISSLLPKRAGPIVKAARQTFSFCQIAQTTEKIVRETFPKPNYSLFAATSVEEFKEFTIGRDKLRA